MKNNQRLIVPCDVRATEAALPILTVLTFIFILITIGLWRFKHVSLLSYYFTMMITIAAVGATCLSLFFLSGVLYSYFFMRHEKIAATLDQEGMWMERFGFIPWHEVESFFLYRTPGTPVEVIAVRVKDKKLLWKQSSLAGKSAIFWSNIFGYPPIFVVNIALSNEEVIDFARQYVQSS